MNDIASSLKLAWMAALAANDPSRLVQDRFHPGDVRRPVIAIGKCSGRVFSGLLRGGWKGRGFAAVPKGYFEELAAGDGITVAVGSHPFITAESLRAGEALLAFAKSLEEAPLLVISGGGSACAEWPLEPWFRAREVVDANHQLVRSGLPIESINVVRKHFSAIKGGRLGAVLPEGGRCWIISDVPAGREEMVASGPASPDPTTNLEASAMAGAAGLPSIARALLDPALPETPKAVAVEREILASNDTLLAAAASWMEQRGFRVAPPFSLDGDVESIAALSIESIVAAPSGEARLGGGEATVSVRGEGTGGRCSELGLRMLRRAAETEAPPFAALVATSDGRDGNSGAAGYLLRWPVPAGMDGGEIEGALERSDAHPLLSRLAEPIIMPPTGNNLRDLVVMART